MGSEYQEIPPRQSVIYYFLYQQTFFSLKTGSIVFSYVFMRRKRKKKDTYFLVAPFHNIFIGTLKKEMTY